MAHPSPPQQILQDTDNEQAVRILLECIHVFSFFSSQGADGAAVGAVRHRGCESAHGEGTAGA